MARPAGDRPEFGTGGQAVGEQPHLRRGVEPIAGDGGHEEPAPGSREGPAQVRITASADVVVHERL